MPKPLAWIIIIFALSAIIGGLIAYRWLQVGVTGLLFDSAVLLLALIAVMAVLVLWFAAKEYTKRLQTLLPDTPPPWQAPRPVHETHDSADFEALAVRLSPIGTPTPDGRISYHQDRETGQLWQLSVWDVGHSSTRELQPVDELPSSPSRTGGRPGAASTAPHPTAYQPGRAKRSP